MERASAWLRAQGQRRRFDSNPPPRGVRQSPRDVAVVAVALPPIVRDVVREERRRDIVLDSRDIVVRNVATPSRRAASWNAPTLGGRSRHQPGSSVARVHAWELPPNARQMQVWVTHRNGCGHASIASSNVHPSRSHARGMPRARAFVRVAHARRAFPVRYLDRVCMHVRGYWWIHATLTPTRTSWNCYCRAPTDRTPGLPLRATRRYAFLPLERQERDLIKSRDEFLMRKRDVSRLSSWARRREELAAFPTSGVSPGVSTRNIWKRPILTPISIIKLFLIACTFFKNVEYQFHLHDYRK